MRRVLSPCPAPPDLLSAARPHADPRSAQLTERSVVVRVITPMFGGGVEPAVNDPITLIRGPSIRGQLRFWWRATRGAAQPDVSTLRKAEAQVWGSVQSPSPVQIEVQVTKLGKREACAKFEPRRNMPVFTQGYPPYALFPFQGNPRERIQPALARRDVEFRLTLRYPKALEEDIEAALWAWLNFGGLGARTRRGCGALFSKDFAPPGGDANSLESWCNSSRRYLSAGARQLWPTLGQLYLKTGSAQPAMDAWGELVGLLAHFRQGVGLGRSPGRGQRPGRSYWPEADSLRRITCEAEARHRQSITMSEPPAFPRSELGLPIVFHFKDPGDRPNDSVLYPSEQGDRMASPVILRPLAFGDGSRCVPVIVALHTPALSGVRLEFFDSRGRGPGPFGPQAIRRPDLAKYPNSPLGNSPRGSALEAFLDYARTKGYKGFP